MRTKSKGWIGSPDYERIVKSQMYYHNLTDIKDKKFITKLTDRGYRTNARIRSGLFGHIVNQRRDYVLAKPYTCSNEAIKRQFSMYELRRAATDYICCGVMVVGLDEDHRFRRYPPEAVDTEGNWIGIDAIKPMLKLDDGTAQNIAEWQTEEVKNPSGSPA